jgi:hypothetical protein
MRSQLHDRRPTSPHPGAHAAAGRGLAFFFIPLTTLALAGIPPERLPAAAGLSNFVRITAGAMGTSISTTLWESRAAMHHAHLTEPCCRGAAPSLSSALAGAAGRGLSEPAGAGPDQPADRPAGLHPGLPTTSSWPRQHSGFSVDAGVCIEADDRAALERLLRYCARPPFAMERLRKEGAALVYRCAKQRSEPTSDKRGAKVDELHLTALELIDRIAALVPPPRTHRHRYFGVLAPNSPLRSAVTAMADAQPDATGDDAHRPAPLGNAISPTPEPVPTKRPAHYLWAVLIARIYEVFPLLCPLCGGQMRLIAFVTEGRQIRRILDHIGMDSEPPHIAPARGPPLWDDCGDAQMDDGAQTEPDWATDWDGAAQPVPDFEVDQRINW